jgi:hypothetical protein
LRAIRASVDEALAGLSDDFNTSYSDNGRPSMPKERALLRQAFHTVRSERS